MVPTPTVIVDDLSKTFRLSRKQMKINNTLNPRKTAVDHLSFSAYPGEIFGLLGPNGAGKTTTMRMIATLIKPDGGSITIEGSDVNDDISVKRKMAFLTGDLKLEATFTPNYIYDFFSGLYSVPVEKALKRKNELFALFGIDRFKEVKICDLSQGMRQKLSIVVSLVHDPDIIVFDEPTNGLDIVTARSVTDYLIALKNAGKTIIISTHIMSLVEKLCDRVGIINNGKLAVCDTVANVIADNPGKDLEDVFFDIFKDGEN